MGSLVFEDLINQQQNPSNQEYFAKRCDQAFADDKTPSWIDLFVGSLSSEEKVHDDEAPPKSPTANVASQTCLTSTVRVENEVELQRILGGGQPSLRVCFIRRRNSISRLNISLELFNELCQACDVFERLKDYAPCFGLEHGDIEVTPPVLHYSISNQSSTDLSTPRLECAYVLRFAELNNRNRGNPWSTRQSGVYNSIDYKASTSSWIFFALSSPAEAQVNLWLSGSPERTPSDSIEVCYILMNYAVGTWRGYITYLAREIRQQADRAVLAEMETGGVVASALEQRQYLKQLEDSVTELASDLAFMCENLDALIDCLTAFENSRTIAPKTQQQQSQRRCYPSSLFKGFNDRRRDLTRYVSQVESLRHKVNSASQLVSNILDLNNGNALRVLAVESRAENANMAVLTQKSVQDAAMIKILTIVTLVYLPVTVVTNFFSTQFVNPVQTDSGAVRMTVIQDVWILFASSVPLTILTVYVWWVFAQREVRGEFPGGWEHIYRRFGTKGKGKGKVTGPQP